MNYFEQLAGLLRINLASLPQRWLLFATIVIGVACATGVLVSLLAMGAGASKEAMGNVREDRVILMSIGAQSPMLSNISKDAIPMIRDLPGVRRNRAGEPMMLVQALVATDARKKADGAPMDFVLGGDGPNLFEVTPELHLTSGRLFRPGLREIIASTKCARQLEDFEVGDKRSIAGADWTVVGQFTMGSSEGICMALTDADTLISAVGRNGYNSISLLLEAPGSFDLLTKAIQANPALKVQARREREVVGDSMKQFTGMLNFVTYFIGAIMALAATLGAANSLYAIVDSRRRELATLRAIGFGTAPVVTSILIESVLLAMPGALLGAALAWFLFNGFTASPLGFSFKLAVTPTIVGIGIGWALGMGLVGGVLPAVRAVRSPVTVALRAL
jgi:putative ABC transport system permease protein